MQVGGQHTGGEVVQVWRPRQLSLTPLPFLEPSVLLGISVASVLQDVTRKHVWCFCCSLSLCWSESINKLHFCIRVQDSCPETNPKACEGSILLSEPRVRQHLHRAQLLEFSPVWVLLSLERGLKIPVCTSGLKFTVAGPEPCLSHCPLESWLRHLPISGSSMTSVLPWKKHLWKWEVSWWKISTSRPSSPKHSSCYPHSVNGIAFPRAQTQSLMVSFLPAPYCQYSTQQSILA